jgi:hypothetical protein
MRRRSFHRTVARTLAAAYLLVAAGPAVALVFCVGADGHQSIESALAEDCCAKTAHETTAEVSPSEHACDCTDTPHLYKATMSKNHADGTLPPASFVVLPRLLSSFSSLANGAPVERAIAHRSSVPSVLRSVILLV